MTERKRYKRREKRPPKPLDGFVDDLVGVGGRNESSGERSRVDAVVLQRQLKRLDYA